MNAPDARTEPARRSLERDVDRPRLTLSTLRRWLPGLVIRTPRLVSAYLVPGRVSPRLREATMLGVTSVNRCAACARVHERWARTIGLPVGDALGFTTDEAAAYRYGQALAVDGPDGATPPHGLGVRHRRELESVGILMQLANLAGNRFLAVPDPDAEPGIVGRWSVRFYDAGMRFADHAGLRRARERMTAGATGDVLEIGIGTGMNLAGYPDGATLCGIDPSAAALGFAADRATRLGRTVILTEGDAASLPYPDDSFDVVVGSFVLCTVGDIDATLAECGRVLRPGGTLRFVEHGRSDRAVVARAQTWLTPAWSRAAGGCRLDHDVRSSIRAAGLRVVEERSRAGGLLVEVVATHA